MNKQPNALYLLNFVSMWECFSYYGMRVLLVLYMVHELHYSDEKAFGMYAIYTTLIELGGIAGGIVADRYLGLKRSIVLGGITIALGHICMTVPHSKSLFFSGLALIVLGTSLFRSNVAAFLGHFYAEDDPRREAGYTLYYTGINIGGFLATLSCGIVGEVYGWHAGFGLAAFGMLLGIGALFLGRRLLGTKGGRITPSEGKRMSLGKIPGIKRLGYYILFLVLFYMCEEQLGSSLVLFGERHVDRDTFFGTIPATSLISFNPLTILLLGPFVSKIPLKPVTKIGVSFFMLGAAFCVLYVASFANEVSLFVAILSIVFISVGELLLGPTVYATASDIAPQGYSGLAMGSVSLGFSLANICSGVLSQMMSVTSQEASMDVYMRGFLTIAIAAFGLSFILLNNRKKVFLT